MASPDFPEDTTVDEVLRKWPETIPVFVRSQAACVGCSMTTFCTLADVARLYNLNLDTLLAQLRTAVDAAEGNTVQE